MPLPSSGQISFNDVRIEMSQSAKTDYAFSEWAAGYNNAWEGGNYAPINVLSSGSRFSQTNKLTRSNLSMSAWYNYNHTQSIATAVTGTLYQHWDATSTCYPSTMLIVDVGTTNTTWSINVSGSPDNGENLYVWYGKPWKYDGANYTSSLSTLITSSLSLNGTFTLNYNYTYNSSKGQYIYFVLMDACP